MKTKNSVNLSKGIFSGILLIAMLLLFDSCARKIVFQSSSVVPAAEGTVKVTKDNNSNYAIHLQLSNLAEPEKLTPAMKTYVVWMETAQENAKNIGQINSSTSLLSKRLKASFETVSPVKPTKIFITAEDNATVLYPGTVVLTTDNF
ncbi:MAG: hypothetical protein IPQ25_04170 [Chitinophagaceae bacterium]|nr:hypothetical protein [Chitinophagaceae bacterium]